MNTQILEIIEKSGKTPSVIKSEIQNAYDAALRDGYFLSYIFSDDLFTFLTFSKFVLTTT
ncbi:hypothetical protein [Chryseobacterium sp. EO14]|uniref:hypothetical protein n=1 Tax=Chryseobacterium sp. EO14 TaxID=2950551 RepID=UPI00210B6A03|nr:hypothetical protein [Chryseobacterium sp. EO14]MCQ4139212.1 hypothetical protein [Chryseobacterium sp. EO14]